jgi:hypothetical protein
MKTHMNYGRNYSEKSQTFSRVIKPSQINIISSFFSTEGRDNRSAFSQLPVKFLRKFPWWEAWKRTICQMIAYGGAD